MILGPVRNMNPMDTPIGRDLGVTCITQCFNLTASLTNSNTSAMSILTPCISNCMSVVSSTINDWMTNFWDFKNMKPNEAQNLKGNSGIFPFPNIDPMNPMGSLSNIFGPIFGTIFGPNSGSTSGSNSGSNSGTKCINACFTMNASMPNSTVDFLKPCVINCMNTVMNKNDNDWMESFWEMFDFRNMKPNTGFRTGGMSPIKTTNPMNSEMVSTCTKQCFSIVDMPNTDQGMLAPCITNCMNMMATNVNQWMGNFWELKNLRSTPDYNQLYKDGMTMQDQLTDLKRVMQNKGVLDNLFSNILRPPNMQQGFQGHQG